jgi:hypothetical protein
MMNEPWYEVVLATSPLTQGDLLFDCPLLQWQTLAESAQPQALETSLPNRVRGFREDTIVMTQACDLEHNKVDNVVLCPHLPLSTFRRLWQAWMAEKKQTPSEKAWKRTCDDIADGYVWNHAFLNRSDHEGLVTEIRVVDFHDVYTIPRNFLESLLGQRNSPRLRLRPPYREHLSQAFARFFMRVGLPQPVEPSW